MAAFTLLEVVLSLVLTTTVVLIISVAVDVHLRIADKGRTEVQEVQLARTLLHRIADDLRNLAPQPTGSESAPAFVGTLGELQFDITRPPRLDQVAATQATGEASGAGPVSDARTVNYYVASLLDSAAGEDTQEIATEDTLVGLVRRDRDRALAAWAAEHGDEDPDSDATVLAPEVTAIEFVYYDSTIAQEEWDAAEQGRLPSAVKITIYVRRQVRHRRAFLGEVPGEETDPGVYSLLVPIRSVAKAADSDTDSSMDADSPDSNSSGS